MSPTGDIPRIPLPGTNLTEAVARYLITQHGNSLPDFSELVVLVPNHRAGQDLARALSALSGRPALIPPRILPLKGWAEREAATPVEAQSLRLAALHATLKGHSWLGAVDKWALADELLALSDALASNRPDASVSSLLHPAADAPSREIALVEAVHAAFNSKPTDPARRYASALGRLAESAEAPLYFFSPGPLTAIERRFLACYSTRAPVTQLELALDSPVAQCLRAAWQSAESPIRERALKLKEAFPHSPLQSAVKLFAAPHLEAEARAAATWVGEQLATGRQRIALIALDRLSARRLRSLLERGGVLVEDETGWTLSTTAAAAVVDRWLECVTSDFPHVELLDLLKSPFLLGDIVSRQDAVLSLELGLRRYRVAQGQAEIRRITESRAELAIALPLLETLFAAAKAFPLRQAPLAVWLDRLHDSLGRLQALGPLAADAAGAQLLERLETLRHELAGDKETYRFSEWRRWLDWILEMASFADRGVSSPVVLTSLAHARGRSFDATAILGADAAHLPGSPTGGLFNQSVYARLGLPTAAENFSQAGADLFSLLLQGPALLTWQAWKDDQPNPPSPFIALLQALQHTGWGGKFESPAAKTPPAETSPLPQPARQPRPAIPATHLPTRFSPTAYQTLLDCPYRFFARYALGLQELDEADEALDKSDYGDCLHRILKRFHDSMPPPDRHAASERLGQISEDEFSRFPAYTGASWRARWSRIQPAYVDLWLDHEQQGWRYQSGETDLESAVEIPGLGEVVLHGRVDRIDCRGESRRVIDYKTTSPSRLKKRAEDPVENIQLPFYAWLAKANAAFLPIDTDEPALIEPALDVPVEDISLRLPALLEAIASGVPLPAHGVEGVCRYCEARGMCRKGTWDD